MQSLTEAVFELAPPGGLFNETVVSNLFPHGSYGARKQLVHRAVASGEIIRDVLQARIREYAPANAVEQENMLAELMQHYVLASLSRSGLFSTAMFHGLATK